MWHLYNTSELLCHSWSPAAKLLFMPYSIHLAMVVLQYPAFCRTCGFITMFTKPVYPSLSPNSFCHIHFIIFLSSALACFNTLLFRFLCGFSYHACYLLCPPHPTQFDYAKIWWLSRKSSPPAGRVSKWLKPCHSIQAVRVASWSTFGSHSHPSVVFLCPTAVMLHLLLLMAVHSCVQCYCFKHYCYSVWALWVLFTCFMGFICLFIYLFYFYFFIF
jgi:hypothetical protein